MGRLSGILEKLQRRKPVGEAEGQKPKEMTTQEVIDFIQGLLNPEEKYIEVNETLEIEKYQVVFEYMIFDVYDNPLFLSSDMIDSDGRAQGKEIRRFNSFQEAEKFCSVALKSIANRDKARRLEQKFDLDNGIVNKQYGFNIHQADSLRPEIIIETEIEVKRVKNTSLEDLSIFEIASDHIKKLRNTDKEQVVIDQAVKMVLLSLCSRYSKDATLVKFMNSGVFDRVAIINRLIEIEPLLKHVVAEEVLKLKRRLHRKSARA